MKITINRLDQTPIFLQIKNQLKTAILNGELYFGNKLIAERKMANLLGVNRGTISRVYAELCADGYVNCRQGDGYRVVYQMCRENEKQPKKIIASPWNYIPLACRLGGVPFLEESGEQEPRGWLSLAGDQAGAKLLLPQQAGKMLEEILKKLDPGTMFCQTGPQGLYRLRAATSSVLATRYIDAPPNNIQIVPDRASALDSLLRLYLCKGDFIAAAEPVSPRVRLLFELAGARTVLAPMDTQGIQIAPLKALLLKYRPKLLYLMPNYHNPTGITTSLERRDELLALCYQFDLPVIEDDPLFDFRYESVMTPTLKSQDRYGYVAYLGSYYTARAPECSAGYLVAEEAVVRNLARLARLTGGGCGLLEQHLLSGWIEGGDYMRQVERLRLDWKENWKTALSILAKGEKDGLLVFHPEGGRHIWCRLPDRVLESALYETCAKRKIKIACGKEFFPQGSDGNGYIRLSFTGADKARLAGALEVVLEELHLLAFQE